MATALVSITPECSICFEILKIPKVLTCGHTHCLSCIERYIGDKTETFPCPICQQDIKIPDGGAKMFTTNFILQTSPHTPTTQVTGTPTSPTTQVTGTPTLPTAQVTGTTTSIQTSEITDQPVTTQKHHCPNHSKKEVEYYCQTCNLGLCSKCIYRDHNDHKTLDLECDSTREMVVEELSKSEKLIKSKVEDLEKTHATLIETSEKLKSVCDKACTKISEKTENIIGELKENCEKIHKKIRDHFDKNESQLTETRQKVMTQIKNIKTDLDTSRPTMEEPSLTLIYSLNKLQELQKLCENMKTDIPPVTYVEWREESVKVCDIFGSTETKTLYQSSEGGGPISTVNKPLHQSSEGSGRMPFRVHVFRFNYQDVKCGKKYNSNEYYTTDLVFCCRVYRDSSNGCLCIEIGLRTENNPIVDMAYAVTLKNNDKNKNVTSLSNNKIFTPFEYWRREIQIPWDRVNGQQKGFIDNRGWCHVGFNILEMD